jgi:hypothetical protein
MTNRRGVLLRSSLTAAWLPAIVVSDTGPFRNNHYHLASDTAETLDFDRMTTAIVGVLRVIEDLAG